MARLFKLFWLTALLLGVTLAAGCVKYKQIVTVMPDGSGKVQYIAGYNQQLADDGENPLAEFTPQAFGERSEGIVAYTQPIRYDEAGWSYVAFTGYFTDINEVAIAGPDNGGDPVRFVYQSRDGRSTLAIRGGVIQSIAGDFEPVEPEDRADLETELMAGFEVIERFVLPGEVTAVEGTRGVEEMPRAVELWIDVSALVDEDGPLTQLKKTEQIVLEISPSSLADEQIAAFRAEMEQAVEGDEPE
ncbi:MAG: hypothetical protein AAGI37_04185 [Planctomycetota bacterium]